MKKQLFSLVLTLAVSFTALFAAADNQTAIVSFQTFPKAVTSSDFVTRLLALPEWEPFFDVFTNACDKALKEELSREKMRRQLPPDAANEVQKFLDSGISTRERIETAFQHLEAVVFKLHADPDDEEIDENLHDITNLLQGQKKDWDWEFDGLLAFVIDVNPRSGLQLLKYFQKGDYQFLRNEPDGDFILKFDFELQHHDIEFGCAGVKLGENRYAVIFSDDDAIARYYELVKTIKNVPLNLSKSSTELVFEEPCFLFLTRYLKQTQLESSGTEFFAKMKRVKMTFRDINGVSQLEIAAAMRLAEDAKQLKEIFDGLLAFAQLNQKENSLEHQLLQTIRVNTSGADVSVIIKLDHPGLWNLIGKGLNKATEAIKTRQ